MKKGKKTGSSALDADDREVWEKVTRSVRAYGRRPAKPEEDTPLPKTSKAKSAAPAAPIKPAMKSAAVTPKKLPSLADAGGFDRATADKMKKGKLPIDKTIDLHGMTQAAAHDALKKFILSADRAGKRMLLVITGKGARSEGVLKRMLPLWLEDAPLRPIILACTPAAQKDGGTGAYYIRLKRRRD